MFLVESPAARYFLLVCISFVAVQKCSSPNVSCSNRSFGPFSSFLDAHFGTFINQVLQSHFHHLDPFESPSFCHICSFVPSNFSRFYYSLFFPVNGSTSLVVRLYPINKSIFIFPTNPHPSRWPSMRPIPLDSRNHRRQICLPPYPNLHRT